ncbi:hypothetical protein ACWKWU_03155 [Chitinophaga lutea]
MIQHNGMRPQDIVVLLKIVISKDDWMNKTIAEDLYLSPAEVSYSLQRSALAELVDPSKRKVMRNALLEFIQYGLPRVFPAVKGAVAKGIPTAYSSPAISPHLMTNQPSDKVVWPSPQGSSKGESIHPLYPNATKAALKDPTLYELLSLVDVMRVGKVREKEIALKLLKERFNNPYA